MLAKGNMSTSVITVGQGESLATPARPRHGLTGPEIQFIIATMREERRGRGEL